MNHCKKCGNNIPDKTATCKEYLNEDCNNIPNNIKTMNKQRAIEVLEDLCEYARQADNQEWSHDIDGAEKILKEVVNGFHICPIHSDERRPRVYVINASDSEIDFSHHERIGDYEPIRVEAERLGTVYSLQGFQDASNDESLDLSNSFILIN